MPKLVPITIEEIRALRGMERSDAIRRYHKWIRNQRKTDRQFSQLEKEKIIRFQNKKHKICVICRKQEAAKERTLCKQCAQKQRRYKTHQPKKKKCVDCDKLISNTAQRCMSCAQKHRHKRKKK